MMTPEQFERVVAEEFPNAIPEQFRPHIKNLVFLAEDEPDAEVRRTERLSDNETLLGYYRGIPHTARGDLYGVGTTLPDTVHLYRLPILMEAAHLSGGDDEASVRRVVRDTIWHEIAHYFGMDEHTVRHREHLRDRTKGKML